MESNNKMYGYERHSKDTDHKHCLDVEILHIMTDMKDVRLYYTYSTGTRVPYNKIIVCLFSIT